MEVAVFDVDASSTWGVTPAAKGVAAFPGVGGVEALVPGAPLCGAALRWAALRSVTR